VKVDGSYRQLNANLLQIENEFYSAVRPKRVAHSGERPTAALRRGGIEYVEIRSLDINVFDPCGINQNTMRFMEAFLIFCLLEDSPKLDDAELDEVGRNQRATAKRGREPDFQLVRNAAPVAIKEWAHEILDKVSAIAETIDRHDDNDSYAGAVRHMQALVDTTESTPSARILAELKQTDSSFFQFAFSMAESHRDYFASIAPLDGTKNASFEHEAAASLQRQSEIEASDSISLDEYLERYFSGK
jgi:glutamate--cysteine ligase